MNKPKQKHIALVLQGGGALGAYQAGVYEGLEKIGIIPNQVSGISIGAINAAIIAGNKKENRVAALQGFWAEITKPSSPVSFFVELIDKYMDVAHVSKNAGFVSAMESVFFGREGFFKPSPSLYLMPFLCGINNDVGLYSMDPLRETLEKWIDFDILNNGDIRCSVGAVNVKTGNFTYFDTEKETIKMHHILASAALPPAFAPVEINGEYYWDGGLVSNTPLSEVLNNNLKQDAFVIQVDVWSARGDIPKNFADVSERMKDIQYSSKTRAITELMSAQSKHKDKIREVLLKMPKKIQNEKWWVDEYESAKGVEAKVVHLIYKEKDHETHYKDYEFSSTSMKSHWVSGLNDLRGAVRNNFETSVSFVL